MISSRLAISKTREISKIDTSMAQMPSKVHKALYKPKSIRCLALNTSVEVVSGQDVPPAPKNERGVPGFPDFPDAWSGDDGSWATWCRLPSKKATAERKQRAEEIQKAHHAMVLRRLRRQVVNIAGIQNFRKSGGYKPTNSRKTKAHKADRRRKMVQQLRHQRQMIALRKTMKGLSCK